MIKKMTALLLALAICTSAMAGCSNKKDKDKKSANDADTTAAEDEAAGPAKEEVLPEPSLTIDGEKIDIDITNNDLIFHDLIENE